MKKALMTLKILGKIASELVWFKKWSKVLDETEAPFYKWFVNGKTNITVNCLDRHLDTATRNKAAIIWEGGAQRPPYINL